MKQPGETILLNKVIIKIKNLTIFELAANLYRLVYASLCYAILAIQLRLDSKYIFSKLKHLSLIFLVMISLVGLFYLLENYYEYNKKYTFENKLISDKELSAANLSACEKSELNKILDTYKSISYKNFNATRKFCGLKEAVK